MTLAEFNDIKADLRKLGQDDKTIGKTMVAMYKNRKITLESLKQSLDWLGFELTDRFWKKTANMEDRPPVDFNAAVAELTPLPSKDVGVQIARGLANGHYQSEDADPLFDHFGLVCMNGVVGEKSGADFHYASFIVSTGLEVGRTDLEIIDSAILSFQSGERDLPFLAFVLGLLDHKFTPGFLELNEDKKKTASIQQIDEARMSLKAPHAESNPLKRHLHTLQQFKELGRTKEGLTNIVKGWKSRGNLRPGEYDALMELIEKGSDFE